ncbi:MAG: hypothetical protein KF746_10585 [Chitinophagaceae bacterium]|nr:hypothetical protein [Chitinophagaceae bacterium]
MRQAFFILAISAMLVACNNSDTTKSANDTQAAEQRIDTAKRARHILIEELKELQQTVASNDKEKIADIFPFPISDTAFSIYIDDAAYFEKLKTNNNKTTKTMFLQYFKEISESILVDQVNNLFLHINVDSLLYKDTLEYSAYIKTEPCYYSYSIEVATDNIILRMDMSSNKIYKSKKLSEEEIPENSSEICEHAFWWVFNFDGKKLHLTNISGAD